MGAAESSEPPAGGGTGIAAQILRLKAAKSAGEISEEQLEAGGTLCRLRFRFVS